MKNTSKVIIVFINTLLSFFGYFVTENFLLGLVCHFLHLLFYFYLIYLSKYGMGKQNSPLCFIFSL